MYCFAILAFVNSQEAIAEFNYSWLCSSNGPSRVAIQEQGCKLHHSMGLGALPKVSALPSPCPCSSLQPLLLEKDMTTILAPPLGSGSQSQGLMEGMSLLPGQSTHPSLQFVITLVMASNGGQRLQRVRKELSTLHRSAWPW